MLNLICTCSNYYVNVQIILFLIEINSVMWILCSREDNYTLLKNLWVLDAVASSQAIPGVEGKVPSEESRVL